MLTIKLKEKDQEVKLNDLKIKELKKTIPNTRLRPLRNKRMTLDSQYSGTQSATASAIGARPHLILNEHPNQYL